MATTVQLNQNPGEYNLMYRYNKVVLNNLEATADKYVLRVLIGTDVVADIRQTPNSAGNAIFDIQKILQSYTSQPALGWLNFSAFRFTAAQDETVYYELQYGSETGGVVDIKTGTSDFFTALPGRGYDVKYGLNLWLELNDYRAEVGIDPETADCTEIFETALPLSDKEYTRLGADDSVRGLSATDKVWHYDIYADNLYSLSFLQKLRYSGQAPANVNGIYKMRVVAYAEDGTEIDDFILNNQHPTASPEFDVLNVTVDPTSLGQDFPQGTKYYYVGFPLYTANNCSIVHPNVTDESAFGWYRFNIIEPKCNDYSNIQFNWLNSFGFRDYFNFEKKNERVVSIARNNYMQEPINYDTNGNIDGVYRGSRTYSQKLEQVYTVKTRFLTDEEAAYLENLFISPDVRVRFSDKDYGTGVQFDAVTLLSKSYTQRTYRKDKLFQYEIQFKLANNINSQRG